MPIFKQVSMQFQFVNQKSKERDSILFAKIDQLFTLNFNTGEVKMLYKFKQVFQRQPSFFNSNIEQDILIVASSEDIIHINLKK
jgi:hypothetical protein